MGFAEYSTLRVSQEFRWASRDEISLRGLRSEQDIQDSCGVERHEANEEVRSARTKIPGGQTRTGTDRCMRRL